MYTDFTSNYYALLCLLSLDSDLHSKLNEILRSQNASLSVSSGEEALYYILTEKGIPIAFLLVYPLLDRYFEMHAFTHKLHENRGAFHFLWNSFEQDHALPLKTESLPVPLIIDFSLEYVNPKILHILEDIHAVYQKTEYIMQLFIPDFFSRNQVDSTKKIRILSCYPRKKDGFQRFILYHSQIKKTIGSFRCIFQDHSCYFFAFFLFPKYRNQGWGKLSFTSILPFLYEMGIEEITLQVTKENTSAAKIYSYFGFSTIQERILYRAKTDGKQIHGQ